MEKPVRDHMERNFHIDAGKPLLPAFLYPGDHNSSRTDGAVRDLRGWDTGEKVQYNEDFPPNHKDTVFSELGNCADFGNPGGSKHCGRALLFWPRVLVWCAAGCVHRGNCGDRNNNDALLLLYAGKGKSADETDPEGCLSAGVS